MPILTFSYVYNNTWGFFPEVWISIAKTSNSVRTLFKNYLRVVLLPVFVEIIIALPSLFLVSENVFVSGFIVLTGGVTMVITGFAASVMRPKVTGSPFRFGGNTHQMGIFAQFLTLAPLLLLPLHPLMWILMLFYPMGYGVIYRYLKQTYQGHRRNIFNTLMS